MGGWFSDDAKEVNLEMHRELYSLERHYPMAVLTGEAAAITSVSVVGSPVTAGIVNSRKNGYISSD